MNPLSFLLVCFAGWMNRRQQAVIEYLQEEVRVLQEQLGKRPRFTDDQRRRLAVLGETVVRHDTIKESCLDNMILLGESFLREAVARFVEHHHQKRNHQGLENKIIRPDFAEFRETGTNRSRRRLGGLLRSCSRDAG